MNKIDLDGRTAIVTGGARGIGLAVTQRLLASGARAVMWDIDQAALDAARRSLDADDVLSAARVDVTDPAEVQDAVEVAINSHSKVDILVNNAGIAGPVLKTWDYPVEEWRQVIDLDLTAVFLCCRALVPHMMQNGYGRIVNIASVAGKEGNPNASAYSAAKAALNMLAKTSALELGAAGVTVNIVAPGEVAGEGGDATDHPAAFAELNKAAKAAAPLAGVARPADVSAAVLYFLGTGADFVTGQTLYVSGGQVMP